MSEPTQTCQTCGRVETVRFHDRGFPPDAAKRRLAKRCTEAGHKSTPAYLAGVRFAPAPSGEAAEPTPEAATDREEGAS